MTKFSVFKKRIVRNEVVGKVKIGFIMASDKAHAAKRFFEANPNHEYAGFADQGKESIVWEYKNS